MGATTPNPTTHTLVRTTHHPEESPQGWAGGGSTARAAIHPAEPLPKLSTAVWRSTSLTCETLPQRASFQTASFHCLNLSKAQTGWHASRVLSFLSPTVVEEHGARTRGWEAAAVPNRPHSGTAARCEPDPGGKRWATYIT